jgi:hypothetical protein
VLWPTSAGSFVLQTSPELFPADWSVVNSGITTVGANYVFAAALGGQGAVFRLKSQ